MGAVEVINQSQLKEYLHYNPDTGIFTWIKRNKQARCKVGDVAGTVLNNYLTFKLCGKQYYSHRAAWLYVYGEWPENQIDHINRNGFDNRISNLRIATPTQNSQNKNAYGVSGYKGVYKHKDKWSANATLNKKFIRLGTFKNKEDAYKVALDFRKNNYGEFY